MIMSIDHKLSNDDVSALQIAPRKHVYKHKCMDTLIYDIYHIYISMDIYIEFRYEVKAYRRDGPGEENEHDAGEDGAPRHPVRVQRYPDLRKKRH